MENEKIIETGPFNDDTTNVILRKIYYIIVFLSVSVSSFKR